MIARINISLALLAFLKAFHVISCFSALGSDTTQDGRVRKNAPWFPNALGVANNIILNACANLPIFPMFHIRENTIHSSSDGQKFSVAVEAINARYSRKFFGTDPGVSVLTLLADFQALAAKIISSNEYEGNHVLDLLMINESDIHPQIHSTDTHGTNEINFALLELCGYTFAPRYADLTSRSERLYGTKELNEYPAEYLLKPIGKIDRDLILDEERNIKRIVASILLKKTTVSTIVKKLSALTGNRTKQALVELDKAFKSRYLYNYIDSLALRQWVQMALNRGEAFHRLKRAVSFVNSGKIRTAIEGDQLLYQECTRLICNAIVYFNSYFLSQLYLQKLEEGDKDFLALLKRVSPIAWAHINFYGHYDFKKRSEITMEILIKALSEL